LNQVDAKLGALARAVAKREALARLRLRIENMPWESQDVAAAKADLEEKVSDRAAVLAASDDLRTAKRHFESVVADHQTAREISRELATAAAKARAHLESLTDQVAKLGENLPPRPDTEVANALTVEFETARSKRVITYDSIDADANNVTRKLHQQENAAREQHGNLHQQMSKIMVKFASDHPALTADLTSEVSDRGGYLDILSNLIADRLPDFEQRFAKMLREQSQQNVGYLANEIRQAPAEVRRRVDPINNSLKRSPFAPGRYLNIKVEEARPAAAADLLKDLNEIASGSLGIADTPEAADRRFAILSKVMRQLGSSEAADRNWRALVLDTRRHVRFVAREQSAGGEILDVYDSGAGRSGGQKQKLVVFCLAAALRYQLTNAASVVPTYGTVVMDEAFDKADSNFTSIALDIFREFGFHMVLATPLKLLQTLEEYVGGMALVTCEDSQLSRVSEIPFSDSETGDGTDYLSQQLPEPEPALELF
jgi:uncharacterized protein YPO0396